VHLDLEITGLEARSFERNFDAIHRISDFGGQ
jgi:hypothetical protein